MIQTPGDGALLPPGTLPSSAPSQLSSPGGGSSVAGSSVAPGGQHPPPFGPAGGQQQQGQSGKGSVVSYLSMFG